jgi:hypothetical protein
MTKEPLRGRPLQKAIIALARTLGWRVAHTPPVKTEHGWRTAIAADGRGFPDLLFLRERIFVAEVKGDGDALTADQKMWLSAFRLAGVEAFVWGPKEWRDGTIEEVLRRHTRDANAA